MNEEDKQTIIAVLFITGIYANIIITLAALSLFLR